MRQADQMCKVSCMQVGFEDRRVCSGHLERLWGVPREFKSTAHLRMAPSLLLLS